jgi:hypothetical protein
MPSYVIINTMNSEQNHEAAPRIGLRDHEGAPIYSLDTNHDGVVGMSEIAPPRPETSHDLVTTGVAEAALIGALLITAAVSSARRIRRN